MASESKNVQVKIEVIDTSFRGGKFKGTVIAKKGNLISQGIEYDDLSDERQFDEAVAEIVSVFGEESEEIVRLVITTALAKERERSKPNYGPATLPKEAGNADYYIDLMKERGRFITAESAGFFLDSETRKMIWVTATKKEQRGELNGFLKQRLDLDARGGAYNYLITRLEVYPMIHGTKVEIARHSNYNSEENSLIFDLGDGQLLHVAADRPPETIDNGSGDLYFRSDGTISPWNWKPDFKPSLWQKVIEKFSFEERSRETPFAKEEQQFGILAWMLSVCFRSVMRSRPLAQALGESGSGKTTAFELLGNILTGPTFPVSPAPDSDGRRDFETLIGNSTVLLVDNLDTHIKWFQDLVASITTGGTLSQRIMYENMKLGRYGVDVMFVITSMNSKHNRVDFANRSLYFLFAPIKERIDGDVLMSQIRNHRDELMSEVVDLCQDVLKIPRIVSRLVSFRVASFALFAIRLAKALDARTANSKFHAPKTAKSWEQLCEHWLDHQMVYQRLDTIQNDPVMSTLEIWIDENSSHGNIPNNGREIRAEMLCEELATVARLHGLDWSIKNARALGHHIKNNRTMLEHLYKIESRRAGKTTRESGGTVYRITALDPDSGDQSGFEF